MKFLEANDNKLTDVVQLLNASVKQQDTADMNTIATTSQYQKPEYLHGMNSKTFSSNMARLLVPSVRWMGHSSVFPRELPQLRADYV